MVLQTTRPRLHLAWFFVPAAAVVLAEAFLASRLDSAPRADALALGITLDLAILLPALYAWVMVRGRGAARSGVAVTALLGLVLAHQLLPTEHLGLLSGLPAAAAAGELALLATVAWRVLRRRSGDDAADGDLYDRLRHRFRKAVPAPVAGVFAYEAALFAHALRPPRRGGGGAGGWTYHRTSGYGAILVALLMAATAELVAGHLLLTRWYPTAGWVHLALAGYGLLWLVGDYRATRARPHELTGDALVLRCGLRGQVRVPWEAVRAVRVFDWREEKPADAAHGNLAVFGRPDLVIELARPVPLVGFYGRTRTVSSVGIGVDDPDGFRRAVGQRPAGLSAGG